MPTTYYASPEGSTGADGTRDFPFTIAQVFTIMQSGDTVICLPGGYNQIHIPLKLKGSPSNPTTIKSETKWLARAYSDSSSAHAIYTSDNTHWIIIDGFEVFHSEIDGIKLNGSYGVVRNCWIHEAKNQGLSSHGYTNNIFENNLIENNGTDSRFDHGIYVGGYNSIIRNNVVRNNAGYGIHLWPSISNFLVYNNLVYKTGTNTQRGIVFHSEATNLIYNNTIIDNIGCIVIYGPTDDIIVNNILSSIPHINLIDGLGDFTRVLIDYNIFPTTPQLPSLLGLSLSSNNQTIDPQFTQATSNLYFLDNTSTAINSGTTLYSIDIDFWGVPNLSNTSTIGAFKYYTTLEDVTPTNFDYRNYWTLPLGNTPPLDISFVSPNTGSLTLSGTISIEVSVASTPASVNVYIDNTLLTSLYTSPYTTTWSSSSVIDGIHSIVATGIDSSGNIGTARLIEFIQNSLDFGLPTCIITSPSTGSIVYSGILPVTISTEDSVGVVQVNLYVDNILRFTSKNSNPTFNLNINNLSIGTHTLWAIAYDKQGNLQYSQSVEFTKSIINLDTYPVLVTLGPYLTKSINSVYTEVVSGVILDFSYTTQDLNSIILGGGNPSAITDNSGLATVSLTHHPVNNWVVRATYPIGTFDISRPDYQHIFIEELYI